MSSVVSCSWHYVCYSEIIVHHWLYIYIYISWCCYLLLFSQVVLFFYSNSFVVGTECLGPRMKVFVCVCVCVCMCVCVCVNLLWFVCSLSLCKWLCGLCGTIAEQHPHLRWCSYSSCRNCSLSCCEGAAASLVSDWDNYRAAVRALKITQERMTAPVTTQNHFGSIEDKLRSNDLYLRSTDVNPVFTLKLK